MRIRRLDRFKKAYKKLSPEIQKKVDKSLFLLFSSKRHPSLQVRKLESDPDKWYLRVNLHYRLTFEIEEDEVYILRNVGHHDSTLNNP